MTTPHDKALEHRNELRDKIAENLSDSLNDSLNWMEYREQAETCLDAIAEFGGVICERDPVGWAHRLNLELDQFTTEFTGEPDHPFGEPGEDYSPEYTVTSIPLHAPIPEAGNGDGWNHDMDAAPKDKTHVIIAVPTKDKEDFIVGEAYFDPENYGDGDWWWAGTSYGDYHGGPISEINYHGPTAWRPLPPPPSIRSSDTGREG